MDILCQWISYVELYQNISSVSNCILIYQNVIYQNNKYRNIIYQNNKYRNIIYQNNKYRNIIYQNISYVKNI